MIIAWDIETCPVPLDEMTEQQRRRHDKNLARYLRDHPGADEAQASATVRSLSPMLGWICCISVAALVNETEGIRAPKSYATHLRSQEGIILSSFWNDVARLSSAPLWVTFNGKRFDVPFLRIRSLASGIAIPQARLYDLMDTYPYKDHPHFDLFGAFDGAGLADVCDLLGVESPKSEMDGGGVAAAVAGGRIADVARYCEGDVVATLNCYLRARSAVRA